MASRSGSEEDKYSDDFTVEESKDEASASASGAVSRSSPKRRARGSSSGGRSPGGIGEEDEEGYSDNFDEETGEVREHSQRSPGRGRGSSRSGSGRQDSHSGSSRSRRSRGSAPSRRGRSQSRSGSRRSGSRRSGSRHSDSRRSGSRRSDSRRSGSSRGRSSSPAADPRGKVMTMDQLNSQADVPAISPPAPSLPADLPPAASPTSADSIRPGSQGSKEMPPAAEPLDRGAPDISQIPTGPEHWRAPDVLEPSQPRPLSQSCLATELTPPVTAPRAHDALPRHLKPHAWDIASLGQEPPQPRVREAWAGTETSGGPQPQLPMSLQPVNAGSQGFGGSRGLMAAGAEAQVVEQLAKRFVLDRKAPTLERRERAAYKEMLQQVSWTALEPSVAQEAAILLSKRWLAPVSSTEALRAFRRCLHSILCDERVLDIVEHQMTLHFGRAAGAAAR
eukprot:TRINITY_DN12461_c0_g1_i1.p1 TRINITY_DN12461_c0_g1~~TRINITY_DN12461_c0_g1_i1.p1  ORF type:complete len:459 (+),score=93.46 TRINITY_DN12461_c0_g1_i1:32-1378(+)